MPISGTPTAPTGRERVTTATDEYRMVARTSEATGAWSANSSAASVAGTADTTPSHLEGFERVGARVGRAQGEAPAPIVPGRADRVRSMAPTDVPVRMVTPRDRRSSARKSTRLAVVWARDQNTGPAEAAPLPWPAMARRRMRLPG